MIEPSPLPPGSPQPKRRCEDCGEFLPHACKATLMAFHDPRNPLPPMLMIMGRLSGKAPS